MGANKLCLLCEQEAVGCRFILIMVFTDEELSKWKVEDLKSFLLARGVPLSSGGCRKTQLIEKVIFAEKLALPVLPSNDIRQKEIISTRLKKLVVDDVLQLPVPEDLKLNSFEGNQYFPNITLEVITQYAELTSSMKGCREEKNFQFSGHVKSVSFNTIVDSIKYCYIKGTVVPQTRISEDSYIVWVCLYSSEYVFTAECTCVAGYSSSCKHVFALSHCIENEVRLGNNKTCTSKKQQWDVRVSKKREKIHQPCEISLVMFSRPHPENDDCEPGPSRKNYEPRSCADIDVKFTAEDWEAAAEATNGTASVLQFKKTKFCTEVDFLVSTPPP